MNKSEMFTMFNKARKAARQGKLDVGRVNRALGVLQSKTNRPYTTTTKTCNCQDHRNNPSIACKHMIAKMVAVRIAQQHTTTTTRQPKVVTFTMWAKGVDAAAVFNGQPERCVKIEMDGMTIANVEGFISRVQNVIKIDWGHERQPGTTFKFFVTAEII